MGLERALRRVYIVGPRRVVRLYEFDGLNALKAGIQDSNQPWIAGFREREARLHEHRGVIEAACAVRLDRRQLARRRRQL